MVTGRIHSIETGGLVDGPGIRFVAFFQGCGLRCAYCHNPDTWDMEAGNEITPQELYQRANRYRAYLEKSGGGVTCSGGEPLLQPEFLIEFLRLCRDNGIHTAIDTSGFGGGYYEEILSLADLVILDVKHYDSDGYRKLTGVAMDELKRFRKALNKSGKDVWIRHVAVPGFTDDEISMRKISEVIKGFNNVAKVELLPYHTLGRYKYARMGLPYRLEGVEPMSTQKAKELERYINCLVYKDKEANPGGKMQFNAAFV